MSQNHYERKSKQNKEHDCATVQSQHITDTTVHSSDPYTTTQTE